MDVASTHQASFSDLPNELIFKILQQRKLSLPTVALVSRHLNQLATSVFLFSKGLPCTNPSHLTLRINFDGYPNTQFPPGGADLSLVLVSLDITSVGWLQLEWDSLYCMPILHQRNRVYARLSRFIRRLSHIDRVSLCLEGGCSPLLPAGMFSVSADPVTDLLNACIEKKCKRMWIKASWPRDADVQCYRPLKSWARNCLLSLCKQLEYPQAYATDCGPNWRFITAQYLLCHGSYTEAMDKLSTDTAQTLLSQSILNQNACSLTSLTIASPTLILPPQSKWLYQLLFASSLTTLIFDHVMPSRPGTWCAAFSWMANTSLPKTLQNLAITECKDVREGPLIEFISCLRCLISLEVTSRLLPSDPMDSPHPSLVLPQLTLIVAPINVLKMFLVAPLSSSSYVSLLPFSWLKNTLIDPLPSLTSLRILVHGDPPITPARFQELHEMIVVFSHSNSQPPASNNGTKLTSVTIDLDLWNNRPPNISLYQALGSEFCNASSMPSFELVTDLVLSPCHIRALLPPANHSGIDLFCEQTASMFPNLKRVYIHILYYENRIPVFGVIAQTLKEVLNSLESVTVVFGRTKSGEEKRKTYEL
ncbi:hypothetical protein BDN72DRAFT_843628 [Pluteus cervinus]|uniref:Uncharacterized protein n=1 Tax=Pluteus cervinus TaxID=181527 RepID=A0ACD3AMK4_9AGAR|nr:hypothetical protein BDN72DRAFT_843628 [Pluteus cervinus]